MIRTSDTNGRTVAPVYVPHKLARDKSSKRPRSRHANGHGPASPRPADEGPAILKRTSNCRAPATTEEEWATAGSTNGQSAEHTHARRRRKLSRAAGAYDPRKTSAVTRYADSGQEHVGEMRHQESPLRAAGVSAAPMGTSQPARGAKLGPPGTPMSRVERTQAPRVARRGNVAVKTPPARGGAASPRGRHRPRDSHSHRRP